MKTFISHSEEETIAIAASTAKKIRKGDCMALCGELGGGKTIFVKGLYEGLGGNNLTKVTSPTFTLMHVYPTPSGLLYHFDLYRLKSSSEGILSKELTDLCFDDYLNDNGIVVVEWGDKISGIPYSYRINFEISANNERKIVLLESR